MQVIESDRIAYFDVDETLVLWSKPRTENPVTIHADWGAVTVSTHLRHIEELKNHKARGHAVVVWSAGGHAWAKAVVRALHLEGYVDLVLCKPVWAYDDLPSAEIIPTRIYHKEDVT